MRSFGTGAALAAVAGLAGSADAFWRMECPGRVTVSRMDPIVSFGEASAHAHAVHGSSAFTESATSNDLMNGDCTSCRVTQDKSAYWHPAMYFQHENGEFELVDQKGGMLAYYLLFGDNVTAFPTGFQMMSGETTRREYTLGDPNKEDPEKSSWASLGQTKQSDLAQRAIGFNCLNYQRDPEGTLYRHKMPEKEFLDANCPDGLRLEIMFPSCWNGDDLDSKDHKSHMAFPDLVMNGQCPEDFPVRTPSLLYETIWDVSQFAGKAGRFVMANGDTTGFGYHADFITGWDPEFLQSAVEQCTSSSGLISDCPVFDVISETEARSCEIQKNKGLQVLSELLVEDCQGPMSSLPGNVQITYENGPADDSPSKPSKPSKSTKLSEPEEPSKTKEPEASMSYVPGEKASDPANPLPGQVFKEAGVGKADVGEAEKPAEDPVVEAQEKKPAPEEAVKDSNQPPAPEPTQPPTDETGEEDANIFSTQYITAGNVVSEILWEEEVITVTQQVGTTTTKTVNAGATGAARRRRHLLAHGHGHHHF